jgi:hypothetical protein
MPVEGRLARNRRHRYIRQQIAAAVRRHCLPGVATATRQMVEVPDLRSSLG